MTADGKPSGPAKSQTYWVLQRKQLPSLVSQRRLEIIDRLVAAGPLSAKELARLVGAQPSALARSVSVDTEPHLMTAYAHASVPPCVSAACSTR